MFDRVGVAYVRQRKVKADKSWKRAFHSFTRAVSIRNQTRARCSAAPRPPLLMVHWWQSHARSRLV
jgi:hypothetical protein